ncbi:hypothetical protein [Micavibrio aeruginosavorus]|uniref:hypothetical protein n=1 Tax=Micavibrio aeruginosavorus TaxID=349221 RepID=UPI003F4AAAF7
MSFFPIPALAAETQPGDSCSINGEVRNTGGPEQIPRRTLICNGTTWQTLVEQTSAGKTLLQIDNDAGSCTTAKTGRMRYTGGTPPWEYCDGSNWVNFKQPRCQDDDTGECYLDATRSDDDPDFIADNIANGINILGVTGTLSAGCGVNVYSVADIIGAVTSTVTSSEIVQITTDGCAAAVEITGDGSPQYRICNTLTCSVVDHTWASTGNSIDNGQYIQLRATSSASDSTTTTATLSIGNALDQWSITTALGGYKVFVTSTTYDGNFSGIGHADRMCKNLAQAAGLSGHFYAWLAERVAGTAPADRFEQSTLPYQLVDNTTVADNWTDLTDGTLDNAINKTQTGATIASGSVWTNVTSAGARKGSTADSACGRISGASWIWSFSSTLGYNGNLASTSSTWTDNGTGTCDTNKRLYCVQQPDDPVGAHKKIFATKASYTGNLGGTAGADDKCQTAANNAGIGGTYMAWISAKTAASAPATRFTTKATVPYRLVDGTRIADDWTDLTDGSLLTGIILDEDGDFITSDLDVATNTTVAGAMKSSSADYSCNGWTYGASDLYDWHQGALGAIGSHWSDIGTSAFCDWGARLICVEQ